MKLAEALMLRASLLKKRGSLRRRIARNSSVLVDSMPYEEPEELIEEAHNTIMELESLVLKINLANQRVILSDGHTLAAVILRRGSLIEKHALIQHAIESAQENPDNMFRNEVRTVSAVDIKSLQKKSDLLAKEIREMDVLVQESNWVNALE